MNKFKRTLAAILLATGTTSLFGNPLQIPEAPLDSIIKLELNYEDEFQKPKDVEYSFSNNVSESSLNPNEKTQVKETMENIRNQKFTSYNELIKKISIFPENQKLVFFSRLGNFLYAYGYELDLNYKEIGSRDSFFEALINKSGIGVCKQIAYNLERMAKDSKIKASTISAMNEGGINHAYVVLKPAEGTAVVDSYHNLQTKTKNIKKALKLYEELTNSINLSHLFFSDGEFKYRLITNQGEKYLDFLEYDLSTQIIKDRLTKSKKARNLISAELNITPDLSYFKLDYNGFVIRVGELKEKSQRLKNNLDLLSIGFEKKFSLPFLEIEPRFDLVYSNLIQGIKQEEQKEILVAKKNFLGLNAELLLTTNNSEGLNLNARAGINSLFGFPLESHVLFTDMSFGGGASYEINADKISITPYLAGQFTMFPTNLTAYKFLPRFSELNTGIELKAILPGGFSFSVDPNYVWKPWEQEFGGNMGFESKNFGINAKTSITQSTFEFCPDKFRLESIVNFMIGDYIVNFMIGDYITITGQANITITGQANIERTNYDGEIDNKSSLGISVRANF